MPRHCRMTNTVSQPSAAPLFAEQKIPDTYNRTEMQLALTRYAATDSKQDSKQLPKAAGEGALFQRSLERVIPSGEAQLNLASHDCIIHKQAVQDVLVHQGRRRTCVVSQVVQTAHIQSQSVNIVGDLPNNFKVQLGSQDRLYITAASLKEDRVIQLEKTAGSSARMAVIIGGRSVNSATFKDGVGKFEFADGGSLTVKGLQEPSDLIVTDNKATAVAGQFKDIGLFAEKMALLSPPAPALALALALAPAPAPQMKDEKSNDPIAQKEDPLAKRLQEMEQKTAALEKKVAEQTELLKKAEATNIELNQKVTASTEASTKAQQAAATAEADKQAALKDSTVKAADLAREQQQKNGDLECRRAAAEYETEAVRSELTSAQTTLETLRTKVTQTEGALNKSNADLTAAQTKSKASEGVVDKLQKQVEEAALQSTTAKSSANAALVDVKNKDTEIQTLNAANKIAQAEKSKAEQSLAKMEKEAKESKSQAGVDLAAAKKELDTAKTNNTDITTKLDLAKKEQEGNKTKFAEADTKVKKAEADLKSANDKLSEASKEKEAAKLKAEKAESQVKDLTKARDDAKTNEQSAKLDAVKLRKELEDTTNKNSEDLKTEKAKTKEESTKAESAAATAKGVHETLTKQLNEATGKLEDALAQLKDKPQVGQPNLSAFLADINTEKEDAERKILIAGVTDPALKKLLNTLLEQVNEIKYLEDGLRLSSRLNSPTIMESLNELLLGKLPPEEQKRLQAHIKYGPGGVEGYDSYSRYFHETSAKLGLLLDVIEKDPIMSQESKQKARDIFNDLSTQGSRRLLKELDAEIAAKKKAAEKKAVESK